MIIYLILKEMFAIFLILQSEYHTLLDRVFLSFILICSLRVQI